GGGRRGRVRWSAGGPRDHDGARGAGDPRRRRVALDAGGDASSGAAGWSPGVREPEPGGRGLAGVVALGGSSSPRGGVRRGGGVVRRAGGRARGGGGRPRAVRHPLSVRGCGGGGGVG